MIQVHKCEQCDDAKFHGRERCDLHTKKLCIECRNSFSVSQMIADRETGWLFCAGCWTKKPAPKPDPSFGHHSVVKKRPQQDSSATTAKNKCSIEGCGVETVLVKRYGMIAYSPYCDSHQRLYNNEIQFCVRPDCPSWVPMSLWSVVKCARHGGQDYIPRTTVDHPNPAQPEAKPCDDGNQQITPKSITEELLDLGVLPLAPLTPEEMAQDLVRWRQDIEEHNRGKEATK